MRKQDAGVVAMSAAIVVACVIYVVQPHAPIYYPLERAWKWERTGGIAMFWYGRSLFAIGAGALTTAVVWPLLGRNADPARARPLGWLPVAAWALTLAAVVASLALIVVQEASNWM